MSEKRVWELTEAQSTKSGDFLLIDNENDVASYKILPSKIGATYTITPTETGFSFDGSNGYHQDVAIPQDPEMNYATYSALTEAQKMDGSNRFILDYPEEVKEPEIWTRVGRTPLQTVAKVISNAINELKGRIDGNDDDITEIKSNLIQKTTVSGTTNANGNLVTSLSSDNIEIISAYSGNPSYLCLPYLYNTTWIIKVVSNTTIANITNTNVSVEVLYVNKIN